MRVRMKGKRSVVTDFQVRILGMTAKLKAQGKELKIGGPAMGIGIEVRDSKGRPAAPPGITATAWPGGRLTLKAVSAGSYVATLPPPRVWTGAPVVVQASWVGGDLARVSVGVKRPPKPKPIYRPPPPKARQLGPYSWGLGHTGADWATGTTGLRSRTVAPATWVGLATSVSKTMDPKDVRDPIWLRTGLQGELALLRGRLGFDLHLPLLQRDLTASSAGNSKIGDLRLGTKFVALDLAGVTVGPSLRVTLPTGGFVRDRRVTQFEPGLLAAWRALEWLSVETNQLVAISSDFGDHLAVWYASSYGVRFRVNKLISLAAEVDLAVALDDPASSKRWVAVGTGGAVILHLDRIRLAAYGGAGVNEHGRDHFGRWSAGLNLDLGFRGL